MLSGSGLRDELITRPEESYRLCCVVVSDLETSRIGAPYIYDISSLRFKLIMIVVCEGSVEMFERVLEGAYLSPHIHRTFPYLHPRIH